MDIESAQAQTSRLLSDDVGGYGPGHVSRVLCNGGRNPTIRDGASFTCQFTLDGVSRHVLAIFEGTSGAFRLGVPQ